MIVREKPEGASARYARMTRAELAGELRRWQAREKRPVLATALPRALWAALRSTFGSLERARRAAGVEGPERPRRWTPATVLAEMRRLSRSGVLITEGELLALDRHDLLSAMAAHFGGTVRAREAAGLPAPPAHTGPRERWDAERVTSEILERHDEGLPLAKSKAPLRLVKAGMRHHGSWKQAIEAAGLDYDEVRLVRPPWQEDEILQALCDLAEARPDLTRDAVKFEAFFPAIDRLFGSLEAALARAGIEGWPVRVRQPLLSRREVARRLRARRDAGQPVYFLAVQQDDFPLWYSARTHHGSYRRALAAAGVTDDSPHRSWTRESMLAELCARHQRGESLAPRDILRDQATIYYSARNHFGSYLEAVRRAIGEAPWALRRWDRQSVIAELQRAGGRRREVTARRAGQALAAAARERFGSFAAACRAAGVTCGRTRPAPPRR